MAALGTLSSAVAYALMPRKRTHCRLRTPNVNEKLKTNVKVSDTKVSKGPDCLERGAGQIREEAHGAVVYVGMAGSIEAKGSRVD